MIESRAEMEEALHEHSKVHFMQPVTNKTPFMTSPLLDHLGIRAETKEAKDFSTDRNNELPEGVNLEAAQVLEKLRPSMGGGEHISEVISTQ